MEFVGAMNVVFLQTCVCGDRLVCKDIVVMHNSPALAPLLRSAHIIAVVLHPSSVKEMFATESTFALFQDYICTPIFHQQ